MHSSYRSVMEMHYQQRKEAKPLYSLNAFSRDLGMTPSHLNGVLSGKKGLSQPMAIKVAKSLRLPREDRKYFLDLVSASSGRSVLERKKAAIKLSGYDKSYNELSSPMFAIVKDWYHFALIEYIRIKKKNFSIAKASQFFQIKPSEIKLALKRLLDSSLVEGRRVYRPASKNFAAPEGIPLAAKKLHHLQLMNRAQEAYLVQDFKSRDFRSKIFAVNPDKIEEAQQIIMKCHQQLESLMGDESDDLSDVFCFSSQLFSLKGTSND